MRRGLLANYDPDKMVAGEWAIPVDEDTNNQKAFIAFAPGVDKEVMFVEDAQSQIAVATANAIADATEEAEAWAHGNSFNMNDYASGDGSTTEFTLTETPASVQGVYVDGSSVSAYSVSGKVITFSSAPATGTNNIRVAYTVNVATDNSKYYKEQAALSAGAASDSETNAYNYAGSASDSASEASGYATNAYNSQVAASSSESNASDSADSAAYSAGQAADSAAYAAEVARTLDLNVIMGNFATVEESTTASQAYSTGKCLVYGHALYRVISDIALGGTIVLTGNNANVVETNVETELQRIFSDVLGIPVEADHTSMSVAHTAGEYVYSEGHLYRLIKNLAINAAIVTGTGTSLDSAEEVTINSDLASERLWFKSAPVTATTGTIVDITDARITKQHVLAEIHWGNSSYITALTDWSTDTAGHFIITGTASAATTVTVLLVRAVTKDLSS